MMSDIKKTDKKARFKKGLSFLTAVKYYVKKR